VSIGQTPNRAKFRCATTTRVRDIRCRKVVLPKKWTYVRQIGDDLLRTNAPYRSKFHLARSNDIREKRYFLHPSVF